MSNRMEQEFSAFWERRAKDFPQTTRDEAAVIFYHGIEAGVTVAHERRMEEIEKRFVGRVLERAKP